MGEGRRWGDFPFTFNLRARLLVHTTSWGLREKCAYSVWVTQTLQMYETRIKWVFENIHRPISTL